MPEPLACSLCVLRAGQGKGRDRLEGLPLWDRHGASVASPRRRPRPERQATATPHAARRTQQPAPRSSRRRPRVNGFYPVGGGRVAGGWTVRVGWLAGW